MISDKAFKRRRRIVLIATSASKGENVLVCTISERQRLDYIGEFLATLKLVAFDYQHNKNQGTIEVNPGRGVISFSVTSPKYTGKAPDSAIYDEMMGKVAKSFRIPKKLL